MWRIQGFVGRVLSRCHGNGQLRLSQGHHVEDEVLNSSVLSGYSSSQRGEEEQRKKRTSRFCDARLPRYTALDAVGWGAAAVLFMQLCRRIHSRWSTPDPSPAPLHIRDIAHMQRCSYKVLIDILSRRSVLSGGVTVKCLQGATQTPERSSSSSSEHRHGNSDGELTSDLQTVHADLDQQEETESGALHTAESLIPEQPKPEERLTVDAAAQNLLHVSDRSVPVILNIIGLESVRAGDLETAFACFVSSAQLGYSKAQFNAGVCYERGRGVQRDSGKALVYYRRAAASGHREAQYRCAKLVLSSRGQQSSETDTAHALQLLQGAADAGLTEAQVFLGVVLSRRSDCDQRKCVHYFRLAADSGDGDALLCLAQCYETGFGVAACAQTSSALYQRAAERGNQRARDALRERESRDVLRSIRSAPCFSLIGQVSLKPRPQQRSQPLPHSWSTGSLSPITLQMLSPESTRAVWTLGVR